jgi:RNase P/RNase MRP subunit p30
MIDVVLPKENEEELAFMAERLGFGSLCFLYENDKEMNNAAARISAIRKKSKLKFYTASLGSGNADIIFGDVSRTDIDELVTNRKIDALSGFEQIKGRDKFNYRNSGLNHISAKAMADKKKIYCIDISMLIEPRSRTVLMGRVKQNIMLCKKYKVGIAAASFADSPFRMRNPTDVLSLLWLLGLQDGKRLFTAIEEKAVFNTKRKEGKIIREGVERV